MAEKAFTITRLHGAQIVTWEAMDGGDTLAAYEPPTGYHLESVQAEGTFADSDAFTLLGSNDGTNFRSNISSAISDDGLGVPVQQTRFYSGSVASTGAGTSAIVVSAYFRARS